MNERQKTGDGSSVCSWSPSSLSRDNILAQTPEEDVAYQELRVENDELLRRVAELQQHIWMLEEKVSHLETSNGAMADDLLTKTAIIEHYVMETKSDRVVSSPLTEKLTLKRVVDFVKDKGDENLKDINRKLQRVLEETLTKNMHMQRDVEKLTLELARLRPAVTPSSSPASSSPT
jgi:polyhydroxyalkanoate synthesis regulator phasin